MMPKEKAKELYAKFFRATPQPFIIQEYEFQGKKIKFSEWDKGWTENLSKQCALIAVDEMIVQNGELYLNGLDGDYYKEKNSFLFAVKQEIENL